MVFQAIPRVFEIIRKYQLKVIGAKLHLFYTAYDGTGIYVKVWVLKLKWLCLISKI